MLGDERRRLEQNAIYRVGEFEVDASLNTISRAERSVRCEPRVIDVLMCLIRHAPGPISKPDLLAEVWPGITVSDDALWRCVSELRRVFEDSVRSPRYIETIPRRGYRLIAAVERVMPQKRSNAVPQGFAEDRQPRERTKRWLAVASAVVLLPIASVFIFRSTEPSRSNDKPTFASFGAYSAFSKGRLLNHRGTPDIAVRAVEHLETAVDLDPGSALAHSELTWALVRAGKLGVIPRDEAFSQARRAAIRAVELDPSLSAAHAALGAVLFWRDRHWSAAEKELRTALELEPGNVEARRDLALLLGALGRHEEAKAEIERAWRLDRLSPLTSLEAGWIYYYAGRFDDAIEECRFARDLIPESRGARSCLVAAYLQDGRVGKALELVREMASDRGIELAVVKEADHHEALESAVSELFAASPSAADFEPTSALDVARLQMTLGHADPALQWIEWAAAEGEAALAHLNVDPCFRPLRSDPRFRRLLQELGFG